MSDLEKEILLRAELLALEVVERGEASQRRINDLVLAVQRERIRASALRRMDRAPPESGGGP